MWMNHNISKIVPTHLSINISQKWNTNQRYEHKFYLNEDTKGKYEET